MADRRRKTHLDELERRLTGPKRVALFGHRAVGKTTLLAMFYRQASTGRAPGVRLAAVDPRSADYLADKIARIEAGEPPPGTLAETELQLRLYHENARLDLIVKDYQGEHVALGSDEPIQRFFADCDAVLLCLDPEGDARPADRLRRQQEIENLLERYIDQSDGTRSKRPVALLITKYDRVLARMGLTPSAGDEGDWRVERLVESLYGMTRHALECHAPQSEMFAVSSYGKNARDGKPPADLNPLGLDAPLIWLARELESCDAELLDWIWDLAPDESARLSRCVEAFVKRYPRSVRSEGFVRRLDALKRKRNFRRAAVALFAIAASVAALAGYDYHGYRRALEIESSDERSAAIVAQTYRRLIDYHPTLFLFWPSYERSARRKLDEFLVAAARDELADGKATDRLDTALAELKERRPDLAPSIKNLEFEADRARHERSWNEIKADSVLADLSDEVDAKLKRIETFLRTYPESAHKDEAIALAKDLGRRVAAARDRADRQTLDALDRSQNAPDADLRDLIDQAKRFLDDHPESTLRGEFEARIAAYTQKLDEREIDRAREYSRRYPRHYAARIQKYQDYLKTHTTGGRFVREALDAKEAIERAWDAYSYRQAYDHWISHPNEVAESARRFRDYLDQHPDGVYVADAKAFLAWWEKVSTPRDYRVTLRRGAVESDVGKYFSGGGPDLTVTIEVAGVKHGPSPVAKNTRTPIWDYTFPKPISWKLGDPVTIKIIDRDWSETTVFTLKSPKGDPLAIRLLSGEVHPAGGGETTLVFASDFQTPKLTKPEPEESPRVIARSKPE
jgi:outer membrane protein assembly factor BamD (BamD/ComL family)/GTPase SAR1 family protein